MPDPDPAQPKTSIPSDPEASPDLTAEDAGSALDAIHRLEAGWDPQGTPPGDDDDLEARRFLEDLASLPTALDPVEPPAALRDAVLAAARREVRPPEPFPVALTEPPHRPALPDRSSRRRPAALWALAAVVALCIFGLGWLGGATGPGLAPSSETGRAQAQSSQAPSALPAATQIARLEAELETSRRRLTMVTTQARLAYPMRAVSTPRADGVIYVCGAHQRWVLALRGLEPAPAGEEYRLWFLTDAGAVDGGSVSLEASGAAGMDALSMPDGTRGFSITLEPVGVAASAPSDRTVLLADRPVTL